MSTQPALHLSLRTHFGELDARSAELWGRFQAHPAGLHLSCSNPSEVGLFPPGDTALTLERALGVGPGGARDGQPYHPAPQGSAELRQAIASSYGERGGVRPDEVFVTASTSEAYAFLFLALCDPGDAVLVGRPSYPLFDDLARLCSVELIDYQLRYDGSWHVDLSSLPDRSTLTGRRVRLVLAVSPNNPTGNCLLDEEFAALGALGLPVAIDEVFRPYCVPSDRARWDPLAASLQRTENWGGATSGLRAPLVLLDGLSKRACAPGLKVGWMVLRGPHSSELRERLAFLGDTYLSVSALSQRLAPELLAKEHLVQTLVQARLEQNWQTLVELTAGSALTVLSRQGGWSSIVRLPDVLDESGWMQRFVERGLWMQPGALYGLPQRAAVVLSLLTPSSVWRDGISRLRQVVDATCAAPAASPP